MKQWWWGEVEEVYWTLQENMQKRCFGVSEKGRITFGYDDRPLKRFDTEESAKEKLQELLAKEKKGRCRGAHLLEVVWHRSWRPRRRHEVETA